MISVPNPQSWLPSLFLPKQEQFPVRPMEPKHLHRHASRFSVLCQR